MSTPPQQLKKDTNELLSGVPLGGLDPDDLVQEIPDTVIAHYDRGDREQGREILRDHFRRVIGRRFREERAGHVSQIEAIEEKLDQVDTALTSSLQPAVASGEVLGENVTALRTFLGLTKTRLTEMADAFSRPTLIKIERGQGARLEMIDAIADALQISRHLLLLDGKGLETLYQVFEHDPDAQELIEGARDGTPASSYARELAGRSDASPEDLRVVSDIPESVDEGYDTRGARAGAVVGWTQEFETSPAEAADDRMERRLVAAVVGAFWGYLLGPKPDDGFSPFIDP